MTTHAFGRDNSKHSSPVSLKWFKTLTFPTRRAETFAEYVARVDSVLDSPEVVAKTLALKPTRKLPRR